MIGKMSRKVASVTGGASGIGRATALAFAREGAEVVVADLAVEGGEETIHLIKEAGGEAIFVKCDVSKAVEVKAMVDKTVEIYGRLDYAFNNAGIGGEIIPIFDYPENVWNKVLNINLTGVWLCMKYEIPEMLKQGGGAIVNTASAAGLTGHSDPAYTASKHGVVGLTKTIALEYAKAGIRVNSICPGPIKTALLDRLLRVLPKDLEAEKFLLKMTPVGRFAVPEEVAAVVVWLCSDSASFVTGHAMAVDGGWTAQ